MNKYVIGIEGMRCPMCEAPVEKVIRNNIPYQSVKASHKKNNLIVITKNDLLEEDFRKLIDPTGYKITSFEKGLASKKLFGWR